jgi:hypothetical protein
MSKRKTPSQDTSTTLAETSNEQKEPKMAKIEEKQDLAESKTSETKQQYQGITNGQDPTIIDPKKEPQLGLQFLLDEYLAGRLACKNDDPNAECKAARELCEKFFTLQAEDNVSEDDAHEFLSAIVDAAGSYCFEKELPWIHLPKALIHTAMGAVFSAPCVNLSGSVDTQVILTLTDGMFVFSSSSKKHVSCAEEGQPFKYIGGQFIRPGESIVLATF